MPVSFNPDAGVLHGDIVLHTAGNQAGAAVDATGGVYQKTIFVGSHVLFSCIEWLVQRRNCHSLDFLYRYKGLAERLAAANGVGIG